MALVDHKVDVTADTGANLGGNYNDLIDALIAGEGIASGGILIWSGAITAIPSGFVICDGNNSTPNLTDRFVIHADADTGGTNNVGATGGENSHTLTTAEMPVHTHDVVSHGWSSQNDGNYWESAGYNASETSTVTSDPTGGGSAHENRPKFYALAYIMKT